MQEFEYAVTDPVGIHARPAGILVKTIKGLDSEVTIGKKGGKEAGGTKLMAVMGLGIKQGDTAVVRVEGPNEEADAQLLRKFFEENF